MCKPSHVRGLLRRDNTAKYVLKVLIRDCSSWQKNTVFMTMANVAPGAVSHVYLHSTGKSCATTCQLCRSCFDPPLNLLLGLCADLDPGLQTLRKNVKYDAGSGTVLLEDKAQVLAYALDANSTQATWVWKMYSHCT